MSKKLTEEEIEKRIRGVEYAIHSSELEGFVCSEEDRKFFMKIAKGELTTREAINIILKDIENSK